MEDKMVLPIKLEWKEFDTVNLYYDKDFKNKFDTDTMIIRLDQFTCVHKTKISPKMELLNSNDTGIWTISGLPVNLYGKEEDIDKLYQEIRRSLLGIVACEDFKPNSGSIAKMITPDSNSIVKMDNRDLHVQYE